VNIEPHAEVAVTLSSVSAITYESGRYRIRICDLCGVNTAAYKKTPRFAGSVLLGDTFSAPFPVKKVSPRVSPNNHAFKGIHRAT